MRKQFYLAWLIITLCLSGGWGSLYAAEVTDYKESFTGLSTSKPEFAPAGWGHIVESVIGDYGYEYVAYTAVTSGGQSGAYLKAGTQILGPDWGTSVNDLLVTPLVKGTISFYVKKMKSSGSIKLFNCIKNGSTFVKGEEIIFESPTLSTSSWTKVTVTLTSEYSYVGIRLEDIGIDEFYASEANVPDIKAVEITTTRLISPSTIYADENGNVSIKASFDIKNSGNVPLKASDYNFQMEKRTTPQPTVMTPGIAGPKDLAVGETATIEATCQYTLPDKTKGDRLAYDIRSNLTNTTKHISYIEIIGYIATLDIRDSKSSSLTASSIVDYEIFKGERSLEFTLKNTGGEPLTMTAVNLPDGFSIDNPTFIIPSNQSVIKTITMGGEAGSKEGTVEFVFNGNGNKSFKVKGDIVSADTWFEDFEKGLPASWIKDGSNWAESTEITTTFNKKQMWNSNVSNLTSLISPKVSVKTGEALSFYVARKSFTEPIIQLRYSKDRQNWSEIIPVETKSILPSTEKGFKKVSVNTIPAGDYYISFEAGYIYLDNVSGYRLATVDHDFFIKSMKIPASGTVNRPVSITTVLMNMTDKAEAANTYKVELTENGKVVANIPGVELAAKESKEFSLAYTPHSAGKHSLKLIITAIGSGYSTSSSDFSLNVKEEVAADEIIVGNVSNTINSVPLRLGYNHSMSETVYKKEQLNLKAGSNIIKIAYPYYSKDKDLTSRVSIWLQNTAENAPSTAFADTTLMTKVLYAENTFAKGGSDQELSFADFTLPEGFAYTGENLRVIIRSSATTYSGTIYFGYDAKIVNNTIYKSHDQITSFPSATINSFSTGLPVVHFYTSKSVPSISGKVTADNLPVEGVNVSLTSGEVIYNGTTDASGSYSIKVFQGNKEYVLSADKIGYVVTESKLSVAESDMPGKDIETRTTGAKIVSLDNITALNTEKAIALNGEGWTAGKIAQLSASLGNNGIITSIDMSHIELPAGIAAGFNTINPNCLIYVNNDAEVPSTWKNVVKGNQAGTIALENKGAFANIKPFIAENISYARTAHTAAAPSLFKNEADVMETICLPFAVSALPNGCTLKEYTGNTNSKVNFTSMETQAIQANVPYLITVAGGASLNFGAEDAEVSTNNPLSVEKGNYAYRGTYTPVSDGAANNYYVFDGKQFLKAGATTNIPPFRGYFKAIGSPAGVSALSIDIDGSGTTQIDETTAEGMIIVSLPDGTIRINTANATIVNIIGIDGQTIKYVRLSEGENNISGLPQGIYMINNQKVIVK